MEGHAALEQRFQRFVDGVVVAVQQVDAVRRSSARSGASSGKYWPLSTR
jgi:hypothetical protein